MSAGDFFLGTPLAGGADDEAAGTIPGFACRMRFSRRRSSSLAILRETPMCASVGMYTT